MSSTPSVSPARRRFRVTAGLAAGAVLAVAAPLAASAHVHVSPTDSPAGTSTRLDFTFNHGCDGAATTALVFDIPEGIDAVTPVLDGAWTIDRERGADGIATEITYAATNPIDDGVSATVSLDVVFASSVAGTEVAFPVVQECATDQIAWSQIAADGEDPHDLDAPAPVVAVGEAVAAAGHGDAHADAPADANADVAAGADPVARWLSGGALVAALAALGVAVFGRRRRA
ncbi:DUF1775 domain-containing protein [Microbacterium sp. MC2]